jgi:hypothetical protein
MYFYEEPNLYQPKSETNCSGTDRGWYITADGRFVNAPSGKIPKVLRKMFYTHNIEDPDIPCKAATYCYLFTEEGIAVGISLCSYQDEFDQSRGKDIALGRAKAALKEKQSSRLIRKPEYYGLRRHGIFALSHWVEK